jgi:hypothetical protein
MFGLEPKKKLQCQTHNIAHIHKQTNDINPSSPIFI